MGKNISEAVHEASEPVITLPCPNTLLIPASQEHLHQGSFLRGEQCQQVCECVPFRAPHFSRTSHALAEARSPEKVSGADTTHSRDVESGGG